MIDSGSRARCRALALGLAMAAVVSPSAAAAGPVDRWTSEIARASARFGIPASWIRRVMQVESGGRTRRGGLPVVSRAGAMGLMQLMPGTWHDMRAALGLGSDPFDPHDNILAGTFYLRLMYDRFGYPGLFAAYNAGPGRYASSITGGRALPAETRAYVALIGAGTREDTAMAGPAAAPIFVIRTPTAGPAGATPSAALPRSSLFIALAGRAVR